MSVSAYRLQVVNLNGRVVAGWQPGDRVELDMAKELAWRVKAKGVGLFRTEAHVMADVEAAFAEMLHELKGRV